jgi:D-lactate dehydrogenase (cytochrome)
MPSLPVPLITDPRIIEGYLTDASNTHGRAEALVRPRSTEEVAEVVRHCQTEAIPLTVTAQRTSTTGGPVPDGGWLLSTELLTTVHAVDDAEGGVILGQYQAQVARAGSLFPPDPTSRNECSLGAAIACNASGARTFRYGATRAWVDAVEFVDASGNVHRADRSTPIPWPSPSWSEPSVKTAAGYHPSDNLLDLVIGQEGTLGVVTRARLRLTPAPVGLTSLLVFFPSVAACIDFVEVARAGARRPGRAAEPDALDPAAIEYFDGAALALVRDRAPEVPAGAEAALLIDIEHDGDAPLAKWSDAIDGSEALRDHTVVADDERSVDALRRLRHAVPATINEQVVRNGMPKVGTDFAVPDAALREMMDAYARVPIPSATFGHIGDNHLHVNMLPRDREELDRARAIYKELAHLAIRHGGTVSAEHGIGKLKRALLADMVGPDVMAQFVALKRAVDPSWILGRGTMLPVPT